MESSKRRQRIQSRRSCKKAKEEIYEIYPEVDDCLAGTSDANLLLRGPEHQESDEEASTSEWSFGVNTDNGGETSSSDHSSESDTGDSALYSDTPTQSLSLQGHVEQVASPRQYEEAGASSLASDLACWVTSNNIPLKHVNSLLGTLRKHHPELPKDARTLLGTPKMPQVKKTASGESFYFGLHKTLKKRVQSGLRIPGNQLSLIINIDGLPLAKSTSSQLWVILGLLDESVDRRPFIVAAFHGHTKPGSLEEFLEDFVTEMSQMQVSGFAFGEVTFSVDIKAFVMDAPARAFVKAIKGHGGFYGCEKCVQKGIYLKEGHKVIYPRTDCALRTDQSFANQEQPNHHQAVSPMLSICRTLVSSFALDYMHLVCLGVVKRLLLTVFLGKVSNAKLSPRTRHLVSSHLIELQCHTPEEFSRKPRSLDELHRWKATEFRNFLLYFGLVVLRDHMPGPYYHHFLKLHVAISILAHPRLYLEKNHNAEELLLSFVQEAGSLYGRGIYVYNTHSLVHLAADARQHGCLDSFSAFPFENHLGQVKKLVHSSHRPLEQIVRRTAEGTLARRLRVKKSPGKLSQKHTEGPVPANFHGVQYKKVHMKDYIISRSQGNNCLYMHDDNIVFIKNIFKASDGAITLCGAYMKRKTSFFEDPVASSELHIYLVSKPSKNLYCWKLQDVQWKCACFPLGDKYVVYPLLHLMS
ncbi:unnamed protein product [Ixodes hexagonus]